MKKDGTISKQQRSGKNNGIARRGGEEYQDSATVTLTENDG